MSPADLAHPYLHSQLIAYIGNKRALKGFLAGVFDRLGRERGTFLDPFAGSGAVSRLARHMGFRVLANDWEFYAYVLNYAYLCIGRGEALHLFRAWGGPQGILAELNGLPDPPAEQCYIARHYAPSDTKTADYRRERLFYTRENALRIDAIRNRIEELYPGFALDGLRKKEKLLLLSAVMYQSATHTNTSGVFKACHKGFGGHGRDALARILAPIRLEMPELIDASQPAEVFCQDGAVFVRGRRGDICYLDPPYNQHQYGSNYHLLNTIALWDRPAVSEERRLDGRLAHKAGIRADWVRTRSEFCYRKSAAGALERLLEAVDARFLVLSYNTEGIIPFEELVELFEKQGALELFSSEYVKYRGGKQSIGRQVHNVEFVLVADRRRLHSAPQRERVRRFQAEQRLRLLLRASFRPEVVARAFTPLAGGILVRLGGREALLPMEDGYRFQPEAALACLVASTEELEGLVRKLRACECRDRKEEIRILIGLLEDKAEERRRGEWQRRVLWLLKKFAHRKYRGEFEQTVELLRALADRNPQRYAVLAAGLAAVEQQAAARYAD